MWTCPKSYRHRPLAGPCDRLPNIRGPTMNEQCQITLRQGDARELDWIPDESVHLVVTSPPYWTLKEYNNHPGQLGHVDNYERFQDELDKVWRHCFRVLVQGGRLVC